MGVQGSQTVPLLLWLLCLHVVGLLIFSQGFLLTRVELQVLSGCKDFTNGNSQNKIDTQLLHNKSCSNSFSHDCNQTALGSPNGPVDPSQLNEAPSGCWSKPRVKKVVIVIIDAMRFDFAANVSNYHQPRGPWVGRLPVFERLLAKEGASATLFKFVADPPTTSLQRLKGLTTGGLPTFIDIGNSFGAPAITEDNLIAQLAQQGRRLVLLGDDTWLDVYPTQFTEAHPYPSFVVKDIHTVDNGVIKEIFPALKRDDWDVLIGHFLGVDHVGHTYDIASSVMLEKLDQMNSVIEDIVRALQAESEGLHRDTLLIVMGDHAQTVGGDHGGGTPEETDTALFALSMRKPLASLPPHLRSPPCRSSEGEQSACISTLPQVDFAPTLAMLLGVPIPYASVGKVSPELWAICPNTWTDPEPSDRTRREPSDEDALLQQWMEGYLRALTVNSMQVQRYLDRYSAAASSPFPAAQLAKVRALHEKAVKLVTCPIEGSINGRGLEDRGNLERPLESDSNEQAETTQRRDNVDSRFTRVQRDAKKSLKDGICLDGAPSDRAPGEKLIDDQSRSMKQETCRRSTLEKDEDQQDRLNQLQAATAAHTEHLTSAAELARAQWTQFGPGAMIFGLTVLAASLIAHILAFCSLCLNPQTFSLFSWSKMLQAGACVGFVFGSCSYPIPPATEGRDYTALEKLVRSGAGNSVNALLVGSGTAALTSIAVVCRHVSKSHVGSKEASAISPSAQALGRQRGKAKDYLVLLFTGFHAASMISDNCIMWEGEVSVLLSACIALLYLREACAAADSARIKDALLLLAATGVLGLLGLRNSSAVQGGPASGELSPPLALLWTCASTSFPLFLLLRLFLSALPSEAGLWRGFRACTSLQYALVGAYWLAEESGASFLNPSILRLARLALPRAVYGLAAVSIISLLASLVDWGQFIDLPGKSTSRSEESSEGVKSSGKQASGGFLNGEIDRGSKSRRGSAGAKDTAFAKAGSAKSRRQQPHLPGDISSAARSTAFARVLALVTVLAGTLALLLGEKGPLLLFAAGLQATCYIRLQALHVNGYEQARNGARTGSALVTGGIEKESEGRQSETGRPYENGSGGEHNAKGRQLNVSGSCALGPDSQEEIGSGRSSGVAGTSQLVAENENNSSSFISGLLRPAATAGEWSILTTQLFFCTGHRCSFDALQYTAAFVGFEEFSFVRSGALLAANTFASHISMAFSLPLLAIREQGLQADSLPSFGRLALGYGLARALPAFVTTGTVAVLRRHLMVWSIFAPKFVFDLCSLLVTDVLLLLAVIYTEVAYKRGNKR